MRFRLHRLVVSTGLAAATLLCTAGSSFAQVRDHRQPAPPPPPPDSPAVTVEVDVGPREAPPAPREERHEAHRAGFVWIAGRWDWLRRERRWEWIPGHWERERRGHHWRDARWERRGDQWVLVDGGWIRAELRPNDAPPPPREERFQPRPGFVWVRGRWDWRDGQWVWLDGHWERERARQRWIDGRWEQRGNEWVYVEGSWGAPPEFPPLDQPPPPPRHDRVDVRPRAGEIIVPGFWLWQDGRYVWQPPHAVTIVRGSHWEDGRWEQKGDHWVYLYGRWIADAAPPPPPTRTRPAPPPPRDERYDPRPGFVWARGHFDWRGDHYEWLPGHWERERARQRWVEGRWEQRGNEWIYIEGSWQ